MPLPHVHSCQRPKQQDFKSSVQEVQDRVQTSSSTATACLESRCTQMHTTPFWTAAVMIHMLHVLQGVLKVVRPISTLMGCDCSWLLQDGPLDKFGTKLAEVRPSVR
eukprot:4677760-Amphidinium_carterae.1